MSVHPFVLERSKASAVTVLSQSNDSVASLSFLLECVRHGGPDRSRRCETGHSTHATGHWRRGDSATQCVHVVGSCHGPYGRSTLWTHNYFHKNVQWLFSEKFSMIGNVHGSAWEYFLDASNWLISLQRHFEGKVPCTSPYITLHSSFISYWRPSSVSEVTLDGIWLWQTLISISGNMLQYKTLNGPISFQRHCMTHKKPFG